MKKSLCHYCAFGIVYRRSHSFVNDVIIECLELKRPMPDDVVECSRFRDRFRVDSYGRTNGDEAANRTIQGEGLILDVRSVPGQYS